MLLPLYSVRGGIFIITSNIFADALFWFFAVIGVFSLISDISTLICSYFSKTEPNASIVISVKNQQDSIEATMYNLIRSASRMFCRKNQPKIIVVDLGSDDDTLKILSFFRREYDFIEVTDAEEFINKIKNPT